MWSVYMTYISTGRMDFVGSYFTAADAIQKIASCYKIDERIGQLGEYYSMKQRG